MNEENHFAAIAAPPRSKVVVTSSETIRNHNVTATIPSTGPEDVPCPENPSNTSIGVQKKGEKSMMFRGKS